MSSVEPLDPRVAELLSALLDGAVTEEEREIANAWLERSAAARAEYNSLAQVKAALGGMGEVEPPFGFFDRMLLQGTPTPTITSAMDRRAGRSRNRAGAAVAALVASAAAWVVVGGTVAADTPADPQVEEVASGEADGVVQRVSRNGETTRTLRQEADGVDWDSAALPPGERLDDDGYEIWRELDTDEGEERVIVAGDGVVVTLTGDGGVDADELIHQARDTIAEEPRDEGAVGRLRTACEGLLRSLSLG